MSPETDLKPYLKQHLNWHGARLKFLCLFLSAIFQVRTVNLAEIATALNPEVKTLSNYRRLQRFFAHFDVNEDVLARLVVGLIPRPKEGYTLSLDRTIWQFGKVWINLLVLGVAYNGIAVPVCWMPLNKQGNSNTLERIALLEIFLSLFGHNAINCLTADREFIGEDWFNYLRQEKITFRIRIKKNTQVFLKNGKKCAITTLFQGLAVGESRVLRQKRTVWRVETYLIALKLEDDNYLFIATNARPKQALDDYAKRWQIESLFGVLKSRGFRFEDTHLTDGERISKLFALLTLATVWALKVGVLLHQLTPIPKKNMGD